MNVVAGEHEVPAGVLARPLDGVLRELLAGLSWGDARRLIETGKVFVDGALVTFAQTKVSKGQRIRIEPNAPRPTTRERLNRDVIAFADAQVVVVRKPAGVSTVPFEEGERGTLDQLVRALLSRERRARGGSSQGWLGVVHRLDRDTTGLLVFARTLASKRGLEQQFREHSVKRRYLALVHGELSRAQTIESSLVADRGDGLRGSTKHKGQGQRAVTHVAPLERLGAATLVECRLETGRTHQIRIHLAEQGHPLVGEHVYDRGFTGARVQAPRIMLHAAELGFVHPTSGEQLSFEEPLPDDMRGVIERLRRLTG